MAPNDPQTLETMEDCGLEIDESGPFVPEEVLRSYAKKDKISNSSTSKMGYLSVVCILVNRMIGAVYHTEMLCHALMEMEIRLGHL